MKDLAGRVAVVTGAASGIGNALARRFATEGMKVVLADVEQGPLDEAEAALAATGAETLAVACDVSDPEQVEAVAARAVERFGAVHLACNNAGVAGADNSPPWELPLSEWEWVFSVNLWGVIHGLRSFVPRILDAGEGHLVNTASFAGLWPMPFMAPYSASKHAVVAISEATYYEMRNRAPEVGVSVLCPSNVSTRIVDSFRNRPPALGGGVEDMTGEQAAFLDLVRAAIDSGISADEVAGHVVDAVRQRRFWILTHEATRAMVRDRGEMIAAGRDPEPRV